MDKMTRVELSEKEMENITGGKILFPRNIGSIMQCKMVKHMKKGKRVTVPSKAKGGVFSKI